MKINKKLIKMYPSTLPILEIIVFSTGVIVMILELTASRILAPFLGGSIIVWTGIIGVVLGSLSVGYFIGGRLSDKNPSITALFRFLVSTAFLIILIAIFNKQILELITNTVKDIRLQTLLASIFLFSAPSILVGIISPYAIKLKLKSLKTAGEVAGNMYALATFGSIVGTFLGGFLLIPHLGNTNILIILSIALLFLSLLTLRNILNITIVLASILLVFFLSSLFITKTDALADINTLYNRVIIHDRIDAKSGKTIRYLKINGGNESALFLDSNYLVAEHTKYFDLFEYFNPKTKRVLMIGGGAFTYPKYFLEKYPELEIDVVEIDPELEFISKKYFGLQDNIRLKIFNQDGRTYLNSNNQKYDAILLDAFSKNSIPFHLATKEFAQIIYNNLEDDGVLISNIISSFEGDKNKLFKAEYATYKSVFPTVYSFRVYPKQYKEYAQNIMLVASKKPDNLNLNTPPNQYKDMLENIEPEPDLHNVGTLTDDYSPVDTYNL